MAAALPDIDNQPNGQHTEALTVNVDFGGRVINWPTVNIS